MKIRKKIKKIRLVLCEKYADLALYKKKWNTALTRYEKIVVNYRDSAPLRIYQKYNSVVKKFDDNQQKETAWKKIYTENDKKAADCFNMLISGNENNSVSGFSLLLNKIFEEEEVRDLWLNSFMSIHNLIYGKAPGKKLANSLEEKSYSKKIFVSGMGWSGSGALYDFFREFEEIHEIENEFRHIEGNPGLISLLKKADFPKDLFVKELINFFSKTLLGFSEYDSYTGYKAVRSARKMSLSINKKKYARGIENLLQEIENNYFDGKLDKKSFCNIAEILFNTVLATVGENLSDQNTILFNNVIHIRNIKAIEFINNANMFCVFRDPRSNYVAKLQEKPGFAEKTEDFISKYKKTRLDYEKNYMDVINNKNTVHEIQFEEFVLSEEYRKRLAVKRGLDINKQEKYKYFKPWISEKNVYIYKNYTDQKSIKEIKEELSEYCWE